MRWTQEVSSPRRVKVGGATMQSKCTDLLSFEPLCALLPSGPSLRDYEESYYTRTASARRDLSDTTPCPDFLRTKFLCWFSIHYTTGTSSITMRRSIAPNRLSESGTLPPAAASSIGLTMLPCRISTYLTEMGYTLATNRHTSLIELSHTDGLRLVGEEVERTAVTIRQEAASPKAD